MFKSVGSNWTINILRIAVLMHLTPFVLDALGKEVNGVWVTIVAMTGLLKLLILGVPMATVRYLTAAITKRDYDEANRAVSTCLGMCLTLGLAAAVIGLFLYTGFEKGLVTSENWQGLSDETLSGARIAFLVVIAFMRAPWVASLSRADKPRRRHRWTDRRPDGPSPASRYPGAPTSGHRGEACPSRCAEPWTCPPSPPRSV